MAITIWVVIALCRDVPVSFSRGKGTRKVALLCDALIDSCHNVHATISPDWLDIKVLGFIEMLARKGDLCVALLLFLTLESMFIQHLGVL